MPSQAWDVYVNSHEQPDAERFPAAVLVEQVDAVHSQYLIDTVFFDRGMSAADVKRSLVNDDGYPDTIYVEEV